MKERKKKLLIGFITVLAIILMLITINIIIVNHLEKQDISVSNNIIQNTNVNASQIEESNLEASTVYMTSSITPEGLADIYSKLGVNLNGNVAVKISTGERGGSNYLSPDLIKDLVQDVNGTIVECNTAYGGARSSTKAHKQTAEAHGFTQIANVDILDENGSIDINIPNGKHLSETKVGANYQNYDSALVLSHFKGHSMGGFGGAVKNISIGFASSTGKSLIHSAGRRTSGLGGASQDEFLESMAEAALAIDTDKKENIVYINVMNKLSVDCDCSSNPAEPDMHDIGILASTDPIALDKACVDLVYSAPDGDSLIQRMESRNGIHTLNYGAEIGLGNLNYELVNIDG